MYDFINTVVIEGVVVEPPFLVTVRGGRRMTLFMWTKSLKAETIIRVSTRKNSTWLNEDFQRGDIITITGKMLFAKVKGSNYPIVLADSYRNLDVDRKYGIQLLEEADLKNLLEVKKVKLPWEKDD